MLSQAVAPFGTPTSFANHSVSWMHISNYISPRMAQLKYNEALPFVSFFPPKQPSALGGKSFNFYFRNVWESSKPTNQLAWNCLTNWALTFYGFWFDHFLDKSYYIRSALKLTALLRQIQCISQAVANCLIQSRKSFFRRGSTRVVHCENHSDQNTSIHTFKLVENVKESSSACVNVDVRLDLGILLIQDTLTHGMTVKQR